MLMNLPLLFNPYLFFTLIRMHFLGTILLWEYLDWLFGMFFLFITCSHSGIVGMDV